MVHLAKSDIQTTEVFDWKGLHLLHFSGSSCSQKTRIFLQLKGIKPTLHPVNLIKHENQTPWFMGINPRGLVPVLVHDGQVIIESNDILSYLEETFPEPSLLPDEQSTEMKELLDLEDNLHHDIRAVTMRFIVPASLTQRSEDDLKSYKEKGSGEVGGAPDPEKEKEYTFYKEMRENGGITDEQAQQAVRNFHTALCNLETRLEQHPYLLGEKISIADIAWFIYTQRLLMAGYPLKKHHPRVQAWYRRLHKMDAFREETKAPLPLTLLKGGLHLVQSLKGTTLSKVAAPVFKSA